MPSSLSAGSGNDAILVNRGEDIPIMLGKQQDEQNEQQQQPSSAEGSRRGLGGGPSGIQIYIHSPTTTTSSGGSSAGRENQMQQYNRPKMFRKLSNSSSILSEIFKRPADESCEERLREKIRRANDRDNQNNNHNSESTDLNEFLKTISPPLQTPTTRQSRMSFSSLIQHGVGFSSSSTSAPVKEKGKRASFWAACKKLKAKLRDHSQNQKDNRKESGKEPARETGATEPASFIMLPVAGRTSGGYRHIAISIPIEEEHLGDEPAATSRTPVGQSTTPSIRLDQVPRRVSSLAARRLKTASNPEEGVRPLLSGNHSNPEQKSRSHHDGLRPPSRHLEVARPRTADPLGGQRNTWDSFESSDYSATESGQYPVRNRSFEYSGSIDIRESPEGLSLRGRHHWSLPAETSQPRQHEQDSHLNTGIVRNGSNTSAMLTNPTALQEYSPENSQKTHPPVVSRLRRVQSVLSFQGMGIALTTSDLTEERSMGQVSYREVVNHHSSSPNQSSGSEDRQGKNVVARPKSPRRLHNLRSLTINLPPPYHHGQHFVAPASAVGVVTKPLSNDSLRRLEEQSKIREPEPLRFSSIMTVADVKPSSSTESLKPADATDDPSDSNYASLPERPPLSAVFVPPQHYHHRPSIDQVLLSSRCWDPPYPVDDAHTLQSNMGTDATGEPGPAQTNMTTETGAPGQANKHKVARSESHQALVKQYEALRKTRERELGLLVDRLEVLEHKNEWWLNSVVPMVDSMAKRLTRVYDDQSLPRLTRERARIMRRDMASSGGDLSNSSSLDSFLPPVSLPSPIQMPTTAAEEPQPRERKRYSDRQRLSLSLLEPESSLESFDSFNRHRSMPQHRRNHSHPVTSIAPPRPALPTSRPYPDSYIYRGESPEEPDGDEERGHANEQHRSRLGSADTIGSVYSSDSVPRRYMTSSWDQAISRASAPFQQRGDRRREPESPSASSDAGYTYDFGSGFSHGMGLAADRLPSRHGQKSLLNTFTLPGGGASGHYSHESTSPHGNSSQHRASYSSARTIDSIITTVPADEGQSQHESRPRPHSLFIPRHTSRENDEEKDDKNNSAGGDIFKEGGMPRPDERIGGTKDANLNDHKNNSRNIRWIPSFSTMTSSSSGERPRVRPLSWPSSYGPPTQTHMQTETQTQVRTQGRGHHRPSASTSAAIPVPLPAPVSMSQRAGETEQEEEQEESEKQTGKTPTSTRTGQQQAQQQQQEQTVTASTEWDTLEPLMRGLMETSRLDLELGRDLDLHLDRDPD